MRRTVWVSFGLTILLVGLGGSALGDAPPQTHAQMSFLGASGCDLLFAFRGYPAGAHGDVGLYYNGSLVHTFGFEVPTPDGRVALSNVGTFIPHAPHREAKEFHWDVSFKVTVEGSEGVLTGSASITCHCNGEGGGGSTGGGSTGGNLEKASPAARAATSAPPAQPVTGQPTFTG